MGVSSESSCICFFQVTQLDTTFIFISQVKKLIQMQLSNSYEGTPGVRILKETKFSLIFHQELKLKFRKFSILFICRTYFILSILYFKSPRFIYTPHSNSLTCRPNAFTPVLFLAKVQNYRLLRLIHIPEEVQSALLLQYDFYFLFLLCVFPNFPCILIFLIAF